MQDDALFRGTRGPRDATYLVVGESFGGEEARANRPFVGMSGRELSRVLREARIPEEDCLFTNVVNARPRGNDMYEFFHATKDARSEGREPLRGLYPKAIVTDGLARLNAIIERVQPKLIIGLGNYTLWALTDTCFSVSDFAGRKVPTGIGSWRGSQLRTAAHGIPFLPTYHPAAILRQWPWRYALKHDLAQRGPKAFRKDEWDEPNYQFIVRPDFRTVETYLNRLLSRLDGGEHVPIAMDLETRAYHIACLGIAHTDLAAICIPFMSTERTDGYWTLTEETAIVHLLRRVLSHPKVIIRGQNFLYDAQYIARYLGVIPRCPEDTRVMHHLNYPGTPQDLVYLSSMYCDHHRYWKDDGKEWNASMPEDQLWTYNCRDCVKTFEVASALTGVTEYHGLTEQLEWQVAQWDSILRMMLRGVRMDSREQTRAGIALGDTARQYETLLDSMVPHIVYPRRKKIAPWYRSTQQLGTILYDLLELPEQRDHKTRGRTTNDAALDALGHKFPHFRTLFTNLQQYRSIEAFKKFTSMRPDWDGRMRCSYSPTAETFRWTSSTNVFGSGGNLQNLPKGQEEEE